MRKLALITLLLSLLSIEAFAQSAWNKKQGEGFLKLSQTTILTDQFFNPDGIIVDIRTTGVYITNLYGEYGLTDDLTVHAYIPFFFRSTLNEQRQINSGFTDAGDELNSFGDTNIGITYGLKQTGALVLNATLEFGLPLGNSGGGRTGLLQTGDGEFNQLIKVNAGYSFYPNPFYATAAVGFNNRTNDFSDEFHAGFEVGYTGFNNFNAALKLYNVTSFNNGNGAPSQTGLFSNNLEFLSIGPELFYGWDNGFGISATVLGAFAGQNVLASPSYNVGINYSF